MADDVDFLKDCPEQTPSALPLFYEVTDKSKAMEVYTNQEDLKQWMLYHWPQKATPKMPVDTNHPLRQKALKRNREEDDPQYREQQETTKLFSFVPIAEDFTMANGVSLALSMKPLIVNLPAITELVRFGTFLLSKIASLFKGLDNLQNTMAIVVKNASGVGKTVGSIAVCHTLKKLSPNVLFVPLCVGFNSSFELADPEVALLQDKNISSYDRVASVVGRRLLLQLQTLVRECNQSSTDPKTSLESVLRDGEDWQPRMPLPTDMSLFEFAERFPFGSGKIAKECAARVKQLTEYCGGKELAVLLIIDEGQHLDKFIIPANENSGGAHCALRFARCVQLHVSNYVVAGSPKMCILPIMIGIDPVTSLSHVTEGYNIEYSEALHSKEEFVEVVKTMNVRKIHFSQREYELLAAVFYPIARDVQWFYDVCVISNKEKDGRKLTVPSELAPLMLMAGGVEMELKHSLWHAAVPAVFKLDGFVPMPSCFRITSYIRECTWIQRPTNLYWKPILNLSDLTEINDALSLDCHGFEAACGRIFALLLALANIPFPTPRPDGWNDDYPYSVISSKYTAAQEKLRKMDPWFCLPCQLTNIQEPVELKDVAERVYLPSSKKVTTAQAFKLNADGTPTHGLHSDVKTALDALNTKGECYILRCGGSAPVDFVHVILLSDKVLTNADAVKRDTNTIKKWDCEVAIRLVDAKHSSGRAPPLGASEFKKMVKMFQLVANYLRATLNECGMRVADEKSAIFANQNLADSTVTAQSIGTNWTAATGGTHRLSIISPATFNFRPLTDYLYAWRPTPAQQ